MTANGLKPAALIQTDEAFEALLPQLAREPLLAIDTESNGMYAYQGRVCLIQVSTRQADYIIDPLPITRMQPLGDLIANPAIEKVFHAAEYDLILLKHDYGFEVNNLFDTSLAARLCGETSIGLADLLAAHFGVTVDKRHQLDNWLLRPLPAESLRYAQMDTHYLPRLRDIFLERLNVPGRLEEALEIFGDATRVDGSATDFDPEAYWKIGKTGGLNRRQMAHLSELYMERDRLAREADVPPYKIMSNGLLVEVARHNPASLRELNHLRGVQEWQVRLYGEHLLAALERGRSSRLPTPPDSENPDPVIAERYMLLHAWRKERAAQRGLDASLILSRRVMRDIAASLPATPQALAQIHGMGPWRLQAYGAELLAVVASMRR
ncbi:MAG: HRDC domain-containing protein [Anaerolineae bacterium]|jgi:ribonuclease D|nr:HRDC domain-containing protein [Anaerolineae bacterium]